MDACISNSVRELPLVVRIGTWPSICEKITARGATDQA